MTALHIAAGCARVNGAKTLLEHGADVNAAEKGGRTALRKVAEREKCGEFVELLLAHKAQPDIPDALGVTPLHVLACKQGPEIVERLLAAGAKVSPNTQKRPRRNTS